MLSGRRRARAAVVLAASLAAWLAPLAAAGQPPGAAEHAEAIRLLEAGDGPGAVEAAWGALTASREFSPPEWSSVAPEGGLVLDEFTGAAAAAYRGERARYRATLGAALAAAGDAPGAEQELRRATELAPGAAVYRRLAGLPGIPVGDRVAWLLEAWTHAAEDRATRDEVLSELRDSGAFRTEAGLAAALDRARFRAASGRRTGLPDGVTPFDEVFPPASVAVEGGVWSSEQSFGEGRRLLLYFSGDGCGGCGGVVSELQAALRGQSVDLLAASADEDLPVLMQIAGLTGAGLFRPQPGTAAGRSGLEGRPIGHSVRRAVVPFPAGDLDPPPGVGEQLFLVARSGLSVWRLSLDGAPRPLAALFRFLEDSPVPDSQTPLVNLADDPARLLEALPALEAGVEPLEDLGDLLLRGVRGGLREAADPAAYARRLLPLTAELRTGDAARVRLLAAAWPGFGEEGLAAAQTLDPEIVRAVPGARTRIAVEEETVGFQREYERGDGTRVVLAGRIGGQLEALAASEGRAEGVVSGEDGFLFLRRPPEGDGCVGWISGDGGFREECPAVVAHRMPVVRVSQLVEAGGDSTDNEGPWIWRRVDGGSEPPEAAALFAGLEAFRAGDYGAAGEAFRRAAARTGPGAPVDEAAVRYNLGRVAEAEGRREDALDALLTIGDAGFPARLAAAVRRLYAGR